MKHRLLSIFAMATATLSIQAAAGDDITAKYLVNADFSQGTVVDNGICTYDYDMEKNSTVYYGQQAVEGWTAPNLSDNTWIDGRTDQTNARAAGLFSLSDPLAEFNPFLGGGSYYAPEVSSTGDNTGHVLGMIAVWGAQLQYTQEVTLPAGAYTITVPTYNAGGTGEVSANNFGFIASDGTRYVGSQKAWSTIGEWEDQVITFLLKEETTGVISVGFTGPSGSGSMPHLFIDNVKIEEADAAPILKEQADALKEQLLPLLEAGDELGVSTDAAWAVYNNDNATLEEVQAAIDSQKEINEKGMTDLTDFFINNAHFAEGTALDNGVCTYDYDMPKNETTYFGMQPIEKWTASSPSDNVQLMENDKSSPANPLNSRASGLFAVGSGDAVWLGSKGDVAPATKADGSTEGNVFGFISVWGGTAYYSQHVTLPAGNYTITIPTYNERGTGAVSKNMCGFIADSGEEYLATTTTFPVGSWNNETIKFSLDEETPGIITIGYVAANAGSGSMPHLFVDEFELKYNGLLDVKPSLLSLQGAVRTAQAYADEEVPMEAAIMARLKEATEKGQDLVTAGSSEDETNVAVATEINNIIAEAKASAAAYDKLMNFIENDLANTIEKYSDGELSEFAEGLTESNDEYIDGYENGTYTTAQINEIVGGLKPALVAAIKEVLAADAEDGAEHSLDISPLFTNIDYANSTVEGWSNETGTTAFLSRVQTAEVWNQASFNVYQTLADMPAGAYEITVPGFYRSAANVDNYVEWESQDVVGRAYVYAGGNRVLMHNVAEYAVAEQDDNHTAAAVEGELYVANSNANANYIFYTENEAVNTITTALTEVGDLTIGVKGEALEGNAWVVWGGFSVVYKGQGEALMAAALDQQIEALIEEASALSQDNLISTVEKAVEGLNDAVDAGEKAVDADDIESKTEAIADLKSAIEYANQAEPLKSKLLEVYAMYASLRETVEFSSTSNDLDDMLDNIDAEGDVESNEKIEEWIAAFPTAWTKFVVGQDGMDAATEQAPVDVTAAIMNAGFDGVLNDEVGTGAGYWNVTKDGGNEGYQFGIYEFYYNNSFDIHQDLENMKEGYYRVRVQAFYRPGDNKVNADTLTVDPTYGQFVNLYANDRQVILKNVLDLVDDADAGYTAGTAFGLAGEVLVSYKGSEEYAVPNNRESLVTYFQANQYWNEVDCHVGADGKLTLGLKKEQGVASDWCPYDNFQLLYLGTTTPTAVEGVAADANNTPAAIFDLSGRRVSKMQKGIYVVNGNKVLVK